jgi:hypothetical protein
MIQPPPAVVPDCSARLRIVGIGRSVNKSRISRSIRNHGNRDNPCRSKGFCLVEVRGFEPLALRCERSAPTPVTRPYVL